MGMKSLWDKSDFGIRMDSAATGDTGRLETLVGLKLGLHADRVGFYVRLLHALLSARIQKAFAPYGLRPGSLTTMVLISANPGYSQIELARVGSLDKSAIVAIVDDLEARGLAIRGRSTSDRRRNSLFLTPAGEALMNEMHRKALDSEAPIRGELSSIELSKFLEYLDRVTKAVATEPH
jgi:DNA-binding MarR family transcriptional regulator